MGAAGLGVRRHADKGTVALTSGRDSDSVPNWGGNCSSRRATFYKDESDL